MSNANISSMKTCFKCGISKPRDEFYRHSAMGDGLLGKCKDCTKKDVAAHRVANLETVRAYDKMRSKRPERIRAAAEINRLWRAADMRRVRCHSAVGRAVKAGRLVRMPCERCGSLKSVAHHESYADPLSVTWLCQEHHKERHKEMILQGLEP